MLSPFIGNNLYIKVYKLTVQMIPQTYLLLYNYNNYVHLGMQH